jgi:RNA polymerase sigma factor (sigma-70 family)
MTDSNRKAILHILLTGYSDLSRHLTKRFGRGSDVEDILQETYLKLQKIPTDAVIGNPRSYLYRLADNLAKDRARSLAARERYISSDVMPDISEDRPSPEHETDYRQRLQILENAVGELPERQREVFLMHKFDGLSYGDVATQLGISKSAVEKLMMKALAHCRDRLDGLLN